jgi:hypothetical protein
MQKQARIEALQTVSREEGDAIRPDREGGWKGPIDIARRGTAVAHI